MAKLDINGIHHWCSVDRRVARRRPGSLGVNIIWAVTQKTLTLLLAKNKDADQPAHMRSLISTFVIRYLKSNVTRSDISKFSILFWRAST